ncbi:hypothetical protein [Nitrospira sp. Kam-Ns4a]
MEETQRPGPSAGGPAPSPRSVTTNRGDFGEPPAAPHHVLPLVLPLLIRAAETAPLPDPGGTFLVADYGAAQGRPSLAPIQAVVETVRRRAGDGVPIAVVHSGPPGTDFGSLFTSLESAPESYLRIGANVFPYATGRPLSERLFPANQVCLGWSADAIHRVSDAPALPDHIWPARAAGALAETYAVRAKRDWERFLDHRTHELRPGGRLVLQGLLRDEQDRVGGERLYDAANTVLRAMVAEGRLRPEEYARMALPIYARTKKEYTEPVVEGPLGAWLDLEEFGSAAMPDPCWAEYERTGDAATLAAACAAGFRAVIEPCLLCALDGDRPPEVRQCLADDFCERLRRAIAADPAIAPTRWNVAVLLLAKDVEA